MQSIFQLICAALFLVCYANFSVKEQCCYYAAGKAQARLARQWWGSTLRGRLVYIVPFPTPPSLPTIDDFLSLRFCLWVRICSSFVFSYISSSLPSLSPPPHSPPPPSPPPFLSFPAFFFLVQLVIYDAAKGISLPSFLGLLSASLSKKSPSDSLVCFMLYINPFHHRQTHKNTTSFFWLIYLY